jgi:alkylation response protein AidB-like acyl-CoA dehydrogenase
MDFALSQDQESLGEAARALLDGHAAPTAVRAHLASGEPFDSKLWSAMVEQGWLGIAVPEALGGIGLGWVEVSVLLAEVGRHVAPAPFLPAVVALGALVDSAAAGGAGGERIEPIVNGELIAAAAWSQQPAAVLARGEGLRWDLTGRTDPVEVASAADVVVVATADGVFLVDLDDDLRPPAEPAMDGTRALSWLTFDRTPAQRIGDAAAATRFLDRGALGASAEMLGGAERVLELATEYAKDRVQFGQPIGSFQAVKHRCADMLVDVEGMRSTVWHAAWCLSADEGATVAASTAKIWCSDAARRVMASGLQVHGGIGFTWEHDLHLFMKRAQFDQLQYGDADTHRTRLAGLLREQVRAGLDVI